MVTTLKPEQQWGAKCRFPLEVLGSNISDCVSWICESGQLLSALLRWSTISYYDTLAAFLCNSDSSLTSQAENV